MGCYSVSSRKGLYKLRRFNGTFMIKTSLLVIIGLIKCGVTEESSPAPSAATILGNLYRQARSEHYYASKYGAEGSSVTSGAIGVRAAEPEHRDAAYYESRCITCDPNKSVSHDRGWRPKPRPFDYYDDDLDARRYRDRYEPDRPRGYEYERPRGPVLDYDRVKEPGYEYSRGRPIYDLDRYEPQMKTDLMRPLPYHDRYDMHLGRDRFYDMRYDRNYDRFADRGNGYDNLDQRHLGYGNRYEPYDSPRRPIDDLYGRYDRYNRNYPPRGYDYDRYDFYDRSGYRRPYDDRYDWYDRYPMRNGADYGYYSSSAWGPSYERGYASAWNYMGGHRDAWRNPGRERDPGDNWKDLNRERDSGTYRPRDYFYDSTVQPGGSRGTSYLYDRAESSTKPDSADRDKPTSSPQTQDNKVYKD
ncbi:uncharacterized protein [Chelonus insularis]|uniref:uncharacterized protein n=1 Tax=Chelonus insularis TaxID=460826 RepID=UPI00158F2C8D|nr:uncharacterized protein LOC118064944 [Chelonus insularis]